jgi:CRISPR-associated protein Csm5
MNKFLDIVPLALTPLTPIHIGCGEDFEPTNYVIDGGILYAFEPTQLSLTADDRKLLIQSVGRHGDEAIREVQRFFHDRIRACRQASRITVPVATGIAEWYEDRVGQVAQREADGRTVSNLLGIERTAHHPYTGRAYIPGSSIKGAIRTGWLNHLDQGPPVQPGSRHGSSAETEADLLGGTFATDPFRLCDVSDAAGPEIGTRVVFAVNRRKQPGRQHNGRQRQRDLSVRCETIFGGQFRGLSGEIRFERPPVWPRPPNVPSADKRISDFAALARACNSFYLARFRSELEVLRRVSAGAWMDSFAQLIELLTPALDRGSALLLRVGRHSGAESVTLARRRSIRIMGGRGREPRFEREATTIWLAADREDSSADLSPFGWLLAEPSQSSASDPLKQWCEHERTRSTASQAPRGGRSRSQMQSQTTLIFRKGDRVRNLRDPDETGIVTSNVPAGETEMTVEIYGDLEIVKVSEWKKI